MVLLKNSESVLNRNVVIKAFLLPTEIEKIF